MNKVIPNITLTVSENNEYAFIINDENISDKILYKKVGELLIELSEVGRKEMLELISEYPCLNDKCTPDNFDTFLAWFSKEMTKKYNYIVSFFNQNMLMEEIFNFLEDKEYFKKRINDFKEYKKDIIKYAREETITAIKNFDKNIDYFTKVALLFHINVVELYEAALESLDIDNKSKTADEILILGMRHFTKNQKIEYKITLGEDGSTLYDIYYMNDLLSFQMFDTCNVMKYNIVIKKCKNCEKYFIPEKRSDTIYCDRPSPQDNSMTCKEYGSRKLWYDRLKENKSAKLYRNIYMAKQMLAKRNPDVKHHQEDFEEYKVQATQWKKDVKAGLKTEEEYITWLKSVSGRRYFD